MLEDDPRFGEHNVRPRFSLIGWIAGHIRLLLVVVGVFAALSILFLFYTANRSLVGEQPGGLDGCVVGVNGNPVPSTVWVDNTSRPTTADGCFFFARLSPGSHQLRIETSGKQVWLQTVDIQSGQAVGLQNISVNP